MSDLFREVDEEVRRDQMMKIWQRYGTLIVIGVAVLLAGIGGWRYYQHREAVAAQASGASFAEAVALAKDGKLKEADVIFGKLADSGVAGYRPLARLRYAADLAVTDKAAAVKAYDAMAQDTTLGPLLQDLAKLRAAMLLVDSASYEEIAGRVEGLASAGGAWRNSARELMGLASYRKGDLASAGKWFDQLVVDPQVSPGQRQRAELMLELVRSGPVPKT